MPDVTNLSSTIIPKSDQLNSEQLLGGPMILIVSDVRAGGGEDQPVSIFYEADPSRPFKPCKTMRKVLILAWGPDGTKWRGKSMELYCEPSVKFGGEVVGGIRISRLSDIPADIRVSLTATKGRKAMHEIKPLVASPELTVVLAAITAATNSEGMKRAKALAEKLVADADIAFAQTVYAKKVKDLKAGKTVAPTPAPGLAPANTSAPTDDQSAGDEIEFTFDQVSRSIAASNTTDVLDVARDQIPAVKDEAQRMRLSELADQRDAELREVA